MRTFKVPMALYHLFIYTNRQSTGKRQKKANKDINTQYTAIYLQPLYV